MIYDDQPQMVRAAASKIIDRHHSREVMRAAFAAVDREALARKIEFARDDRYWSLPPRERIKADLVAAGIIPEREHHPNPNRDYTVPESELREGFGGIA